MSQTKDLTPYRSGTPTSKAPNPSDLFHGRIEINWRYLVERRPLVRQLHPELPAYLLLPEVHQLLDAATHPRDHLLVSLLWHTGARISEALALTPERLVLEDTWSSGVLLDQLKKRGRPRQAQRQIIRKRWVPVTDERFILELRRYLEGQNIRAGERLFPFTRQWAYKRLHRLQEHVAMPIGVHPHTLRHSFAVNAVLHGQPLTVIQGWLGHASIEHTEIYTRVLATETNHLMRYMAF